MKILITDIHHGNGGGHVTYILSLLRGLKGQCDLTLASPPSGRLFKQAQAIDGIRVLPGLYTSRPLTLLKEVSRLRRFLAQERFDVVHVNGSADHRHVMLARLGVQKGPAIVWTKHNTNRIDSVGNRLRATFGTDLAIGVSEYVADQLRASPYGRCSVHAVHHGVDAGFFAPPGMRERQAYRESWFGSLSDDAVVFGSTGGTDLAKGWMLLARAVAALPAQQRRRVRMLVAGDPPQAPVLDDLRRLGLEEGQVVFPGLVADVRPVLGACDVGFVLSYKEAASYALYEAMAMGLPGLVSDAGGLPEGVREGIEGWIVPAQDLDSLTRRLEFILNQDKTTLERMGASARSRIEAAFSVPVFLNRMQEIYREAQSRVGGGVHDG